VGKKSRKGNAHRRKMHHTNLCSIHFQSCGEERIGGKDQGGPLFGVRRRTELASFIRTMNVWPKSRIRTSLKGKSR